MPRLQGLRRLRWLWRLWRLLVVVVRRLQMGLLKVLISLPSGKLIFAPSKFGSLAMLLAMRRASSRLSTLAMWASFRFSRVEVAKLGVPIS